MPWSLIPFGRSRFCGLSSPISGGSRNVPCICSPPTAKEIFTQVLRYSQQQGYMPIWCIIKQHRCDLSLLSYQVDGFSLELNYPRTHRNAQSLMEVLQYMIAVVVEGGGRFYLAKDHFLTQAQFRQSVGDEVVDSFLDLKQRFDPEMRLQSDLFRRVFQEK